MLVLQGLPRKVSRVQETPFEIFSISVLLLVLIYGNDIIIMSFSMYIITVADHDTLIEQSP